MNKSSSDLSGPDSPHFQVPHSPAPNSVARGVDVDLPGQSRGESIVAWEEVAEGRFMPRRVRGSCVGRALG